LSGGTYTSNANVVLYAVWEHLNTVHIKANGAYRDGELYIRSGGVWYKVIPYINIDGVWKEGGI
jgi:hypothetical protein